MSIYFYEPSYNWDRLFDQDSSYGSPFRQRHHRLNQGSEGNSDVSRALMKPQMDLHENHESNTVTATFEFPGLNKDDISIEVHNGRMTISAENKISTQHEESGYAVRERRFGKWSRTLQLPQGVKESEIKAGMEHGVLTINFPKASPDSGSKRIMIS